LVLERESGQNNSLKLPFENNLLFFALALIIKTIFPNFAFIMHDLVLEILVLEQKCLDLSVMP